MAVINGEQKNVTGQNLASFLNDEGYDISKIVVERNLEIIPKDKLVDIVIEEGDSIEILQFVGGG